MTNSSKIIVSVILPTYNRAETLSSAVKSVLDQSFTALELIVIDDASTDNTSEVISMINDPRLVYLKIKKPHDGISFERANIARNVGLRISRGRYIAFQDSDDLWFKHRLEKQVNYFENQPARVGVVYSSIWRTAHNQRTLIPRPSQEPKEGDLSKALLYGNFVPGLMLLIRKKCFDTLGLMDEAFPKYQDWELLLRISEKYRFAYYDEPLAETYESVNSISKVPRNKYTALKLLLNKYHNRFKKEPKAYSRHLATLGRLALSFPEISIQEARKYSFMSLKHNPLNTNAYLAIVFSLMGKKLYGIFRSLFKHR